MIVNWRAEISPTIIMHLMMAKEGETYCATDMSNEPIQP
jgi:hypothetical protein